MWQQFWFQNIHYVLQVFVAFMMITAGWIYLDGWLLERKWKTFFRSAGFFVLALWSFLDAIAIDPSSVFARWVDVAGLFGSGLVFLSLLIDPVPVKPGEKPIRFFSEFWEKHFVAFPASFGALGEWAGAAWEWLRGVLQNLSAWFGNFNLWTPDGSGGGASEWLRSIPQKISDWFGSWPEGFSVFWNSLGAIPAAIWSFIQSLGGWFAGLPSGIGSWVKEGPLGIAAFFGGALLFIFQPKLLTFLFFALISFLLWLHYSRGIQREWKYFFRGFLVLSVSSAVAILYFWRDSENVFISRILSPYQPVWIIENAALLIGAAFLAVWAWGFIRFRIFPQIFSGFIATSFLIFVSMTIIYTGLLLNRAQEGAIKDLETNVRTFDFALRKVKDSAILAARIAAANPQVREALRLNNKEALFKNLNSLMFENETDFMLVINEGGEVLMRAEDIERFGDSLAEDPVVWRALDGKAVVTTALEKGVALSKVTIRASSPIVDTEASGDPRIIGAVITGFLLDNAFVDGIKKITGLEVAVFAENVRSASTFTLPESEFRLIGAQEVNSEILEKVFREKKPFTGLISLLNQPYLAAYIPIEDVEETVVGMFFTGRSQSALLALASDTIKRTFALSVIFMIISIIPLRLLAGFITRNQEV